VFYPEYEIEHREIFPQRRDCSDSSRKSRFKRVPTGTVGTTSATCRTPSGVRRHRVRMMNAAARHERDAHADRNPAKRHGRGGK
jgi:hypothetical protein